MLSLLHLPAFVLLLVLTVNIFFACDSSARSCCSCKEYKYRGGGSGGPPIESKTKKTTRRNPTVQTAMPFLSYQGHAAVPWLFRLGCQSSRPPRAVRPSSTGTPPAGTLSVEGQYEGNIDEKDKEIGEGLTSCSRYQPQICMLPLFSSMHCVNCVVAPWQLLPQFSCWADDGAPYCCTGAACWGVAGASEEEEPPPKSMPLTAWPTVEPMATPAAVLAIWPIRPGP